MWKNVLNPVDAKEKCLHIHFSIILIGFLVKLEIDDSLTTVQDKYGKITSNVRGASPPHARAHVPFHQAQRTGRSPWAGDWKELSTPALPFLPQGSRHHKGPFSSVLRHPRAQPP